MLPKPEKNRKNLSAEQLDLVESIDGEKKDRQRRITLIVSLFLTIGLSIIFWVFSNFKNFNFSVSLPKINVPTPNSSSTSISQINLNQISGFNPNSWSIQVHDLTKNQSIYSLNSPPLLPSQLKTITDSLLTSSDTQKDGIDLILPPGAVIKIHHISTSPYEANLLINTPQKTLYFYIKINNPDHNQPQLIPQIIEEIYWSALNNPT